MLIRLSSQRTSAPRDLVDLLQECHQRIRYFVALAREAGVQEEAPRDQVSEACASVERYFTEALPLHLADEEESIVPRLRGLSPDVDRALDLMARQHRQHEAELSALLQAANAVRHDPGDGTAKHALASAATRLDSDFGEHLTLEETLIFPAIRQRLSAEIQAKIVDELRLRRRHDATTSGLSFTGEHGGRS